MYEPQVISVERYFAIVNCDDERLLNPAELRTYDKYWDNIRTQLTYIFALKRNGYQKEIIPIVTDNGKIEIGKSMKKKCFAIEDIIVITGLSEEEIENL